MSRKVTLNVNDNPIELGFYVEQVVYHTAEGIIKSLQNTGDIKELELTAEKGKVTIILNGERVSLKKFPMLIITGILEGLVKHLKGVEGIPEKIEITVKQ